MPKEDKETKTVTTEKQDRQERHDRYEVSETYQVNGYVVKDISSGESYSIIEALAKLMNDVDLLRKHLGY